MIENVSDKDTSSIEGKRILLKDHFDGKDQKDKVVDLPGLSEYLGRKKAEDIKESHSTSLCVKGRVTRPGRSLMKADSGYIKRGMHGPVITMSEEEKRRINLKISLEEVEQKVKNTTFTSDDMKIAFMLKYSYLISELQGVEGFNIKDMLEFMKLVKIPFDQPKRLSYCMSKFWNTFSGDKYSPTNYCYGNGMLIRKHEGMKNGGNRYTVTDPAFFRISVDDFMKMKNDAENRKRRDKKSGKIYKDKPVDLLPELPEKEIPIEAADDRTGIKPVIHISSHVKPDGTNMFNIVFPKDSQNIELTISTSDYNKNITDEI